MATINYITLQLPAILWQYSEVITDTPHFQVRRYKHKKGVIFRLPHDLKVGETCHAFIEHEINLSNTIKTGTLTMKVQVTFVPCHMGVFSGFQHLEGSYECEWEDEGMGYDRFVPNYDSSANVKNIIPLPPNLKTNLYEYLNEILFQHCDDPDMISKYAVDLGCKKDQLRTNFVPAPVQTATTKAGIRAHQLTMNFYNMITNNEVKLLPEPKQ